MDLFQVGSGSYIEDIENIPLVEYPFNLRYSKTGVFHFSLLLYRKNMQNIPPVEYLNIRNF